MEEFDLLREKIVSHIEYDELKYLYPLIEKLEKEIERLEEIEFRYNDLLT